MKKTLSIHNPSASGRPADFGKSPFKVPEGYFEALAERVMAQTPEQSAQPAEQPAVKSIFYAKLKPYIYMAAMFAGLYFGVFVFKYQRKLVEQKAKVANVQPAQAVAVERDLAVEGIDEYIDDVCDYMMVSSHDILACVSGDDF